MHVSFHVNAVKDTITVYEFHSDDLRHIPVDRRCALLQERKLNSCFKKMDVSFKVKPVKNPIAVNKLPPQDPGKIPVNHRCEPGELAAPERSVI